MSSFTIGLFDWFIFDLLFAVNASNATSFAVQWLHETAWMDENGLLLQNMVDLSYFLFQLFVLALKRKGILKNVPILYSRIV